MAVLKIARMGHPVLMRPAAAVDDPSAPEIRVLVHDMIETMRDAPGIGLAAPQVHVPLRIVVYYVPTDREDGEAGRPLTVLINPDVVPLSAEDEMRDGVEGCLSLPGMAGVVPRYARVRVRATGLDGGALDYEATGYHARVVQHECDHLDGILYPMRMTDLSRFGYVEEMRKQVEVADREDDAEEADTEEEGDAA